MQERKTLQREVKDDLGLQGARHTDLDLHIRTVDPPHVPDLQLEALLEDMDLTSIAIIVAEVAADEGEEDEKDPNTNPHFGVMQQEEEEERKKRPVIAEEDKEKPNFGLSGSLAAETNTTVSGTVLKYNEPPEARKPSQKWRLYVFKGDKEIDLLHIHRQSAFLFGRDRNVVDVPIDHPSCSKQHAVLQFRQIVETGNLGQSKRTTKPFIIDLGSANGTFVNGTQIPATRYYELKLSDVLKFGASTREFVLLHESAEA
ncbi:Smad nuclear-interacting protein 1 [Mortierella antarctica]|nr:Smad nuclear-interacting protein 1 [Mortierella antarctica]